MRWTDTFSFCHVFLFRSFFLFNHDGDVDFCLFECFTLTEMVNTFIIYIFCVRIITGLFFSLHFKQMSSLFKDTLRYFVSFCHMVQHVKTKQKKNELNRPTLAALLMYYINIFHCSFRTFFLVPLSLKQNQSIHNTHTHMHTIGFFSCVFPMPYKSTIRFVDSQHIIFTRCFNFEANILFARCINIIINKQ